MRKNLFAVLLRDSARNLFRRGTDLINCVLLSPKNEKGAGRCGHVNFTNGARSGERSCLSLLGVHSGCRYYGNVRRNVSAGFRAVFHSCLCSDR